MGFFRGTIIGKAKKPDIYLLMQFLVALSRLKQNAEFPLSFQPFQNKVKIRVNLHNKGGISVFTINIGIFQKGVF